MVMTNNPYIDKKSEDDNLEKLQHTILSLLSDHLNEVNKLNDEMKLDLYLSASEIYKKTITSRDVKSLQSTVQEFLSARERALQGQTLDYCFQPHSPANQ